MGNLLETSSFDSVYQLEMVDLVKGGAGNISNRQAQQLVNRTKYLNDNKQGASVNLTAIATLVTGADQLPYYTGSGTAALTTLSAYARTLLVAANAGAALTTLGAAPLASPAFTGNPTALTQSPGDNSTRLATTAYTDAAVAAATVGLWDDRGSYDASGNAFPSSGGSGAAGAILKGDIWTISVPGTLGGKAVKISDTARAIVDSPGQTAGNWALLQGDLGYVPANVANNLSDLTNAGTARTNLGLGTIATQAASAIAITGGTIDGTVIGGTTAAAATVTTLTASGNVAVNGGSLTTTQATANLFNAGATALNIGGAATTLALGATTGTMTLNNPTVVGSQATQNLWNTVATTLNLGGAATAIVMGATTGSATINNPTVLGSQATQNLWNTVATTLNLGGAATAIVMGATTGSATINNPTVLGSQTTQNLWNTVATTLNLGGAATTLAIGATSGTMTLNNPTVLGSQATQNLWNTVATTLNLGGAATAIVMGAATGSATINNPTVLGSQTTQNLWNTVATTLNLGGAATAIVMGAATGSATINNPTVLGSQTTQNLWNTFATTINFGGAATTLNLGAATGTTSVKNDLKVVGKAGFYNVAPVSQAAAITQTYSTASRTHAARTAAALTDSTGGAVSTTLAAIAAGALYAQADMVAVKNAIASLADQINKGRTDDLNTAQVLNAVIDDFQAYGLEQ